MRPLRIIVAVPTLVLMLAASACGNAPASIAPTPAGGGGAPTAAVGSGGAPTAAASGGGVADAGMFEAFDRSQFDRPTSIDNPWMPLRPGTRLVYEGTTVDEEGVAVPHRIEINVTDLTKEIGGVRSVVSWDLDYSDGQLVEAELAFFAQDNSGNVWRMGEYPEAYEDGLLVEAPTWIHGVEDSRAGIMMQAEPRVGTPSYSQGWGPAVNWTDRGQVDQIAPQTCVPVACYDQVLVIAETSASEPDAQQLKYYARGVGNVRVGWRGVGEQTKETLELVEIAQLGPEALAEVRAKALELERSAYEISKDVYGRTPPVELPSGVSVAAPPQPTAASAAAEAPTTSGASVQARAGDIVVYASELPASALSEFEFWDDPAAQGGRLVGTRNTGGHLDPPPEDDPHVTFTVPVQGGTPYRCWVHMKVGPPLGESRANMLWVQLSNALDHANTEAFKPDSGSYLTAQGPGQEGWAWVGCDLAGAGGPASLITFRSAGEVTVRMQAGMEGVGFDQFLLSPTQFLEQPPSGAIVER